MKVSVVPILLAFMLGWAIWVLYECSVCHLRFAMLGVVLMQSRILGESWKSFPTIPYSSHFLVVSCGLCGFRTKAVFCMHRMRV